MSIMAYFKKKFWPHFRPLSNFQGHLSAWFILSKLLRISVGSLIAIAWDPRYPVFEIPPIKSQNLGVLLIQIAAVRVAGGADEPGRDPEQRARHHPLRLPVPAHGAK